MQPGLQLVVVEWDDAWGNAEAVVTLDTVSSKHEPEIIHSLGWVLKDDAKGISIVTEYYDDDTFRGQTFIPRAMIRSVTPFQLSKPRRKKEAPQ